MMSTVVEEWASERAAKRGRLQEEIASKSQVAFVLPVDETMMEKEPACNLNSSGTEFAVLEQFHEDSEEFREDSGSIGCQLNWVAFRWQRMLNWPRYGSNLPAREVQQKFIYRAERSKKKGCYRAERSKKTNELLTSDLSQSGFEGNDEKTQFYTGILTFSMLMQLFTLIAPHVVSTITNASCNSRNICCFYYVCG